LTDQDLEKIGVLLGHRRKMLAAITEMTGSAPAAPAPTRATEPKPHDTAERRQVTVMFTDLVGSTASVGFNNRARVAALALEHHLPSMFGYREGPEAGGLLGYGPDVNAAFRRCAVYVDKIIRGAQPSELPVKQTSAFILTVNLKTAKALGLIIPANFLALADEVIE
jgi:hypothetical protein